MGEPSSPGSPLCHTGSALFSHCKEVGERGSAVIDGEMFHRKLPLEVLLHLDEDTDASSVTVTDVRQ